MTPDLNSELAVIPTSISGLDFGKSYVDFLFWSLFMTLVSQNHSKIGSRLGLLYGIMYYSYIATFCSIVNVSQGIQE